MIACQHSANTALFQSNFALGAEKTGTFAVDGGLWVAILGGAGLICAVDCFKLRQANQL